MFKKIFSLLLVAAAFTSCNKIKPLANINVVLPYTQSADVPYFDTSIRLPQGGISMSLPVQQIETNAQEALTLYNTDAEHIIDVKLADFVNELDKNANFDFLDSVKIYISTDKMPEILIASSDNIQKGISNLSLTCSDMNLKDYFLDEKIYMRLHGHFKSLPHVKTSYKVKMSFKMLANPVS